MAYKLTTLLVLDVLIIACNVAFVVDDVTDLDGFNATSTMPLDFGVFILLIMGAVLLVDRIMMVGAGFLEILADLVGIVGFEVIFPLSNDVVLFTKTFDVIKVVVFIDVGMSLVVFVGTYLGVVVRVVLWEGKPVCLAKVAFVFGFTVDVINLGFNITTGTVVRTIM